MSKRKNFSHLDQSKRDRLACLLLEGHKQVDIAKTLNVDPSTISREIHRLKKHQTYDATAAQRQADNKRRESKWKGMVIEADPDLRQHIISELQKRRSPDEIAGRMKRQKRKYRVGKDAIYTWLYSGRGQRYTKYLCTKRSKPKRHTRKTERALIPNRIPLDKRPKTRGLTHAEGDTFVSPKKSQSTASVAVVSLQKEKLLRMRKLDNFKPAGMKSAIRDVCDDLTLDTLTLDNGIENRDHEEFGVPTYFCDPYSPWQKPHVENSIGLVRRWFLPKGTDLTDVTQKQLDEYASILNNKYRRSLGYRSAIEYASARGILKEKRKCKGDS